MTLNNFTIKAQEAIQKALEVAAANQNQAVDDLHLLKGLLLADEHVLPFLFKKAGADPALITRNLDAKLGSLPKVSGNGTPYLAPDAEQCLLKSQNLLKDFQDEYVTVELILLALIEQGSQASRLLKEAGLEAARVKTAIKEMRKGSSAKDPNAETPTKPWKNTPGTSTTWRVTENSTRSSAATRKSAVYCRS